MEEVTDRNGSQPEYSLRRGARQRVFPPATTGRAEGASHCMIDALKRRRGPIRRRRGPESPLASSPRRAALVVTASIAGACFAVAASLVLVRAAVRPSWLGGEADALEGAGRVPDDVFASRWLLVSTALSRSTGTLLLATILFVLFSATAWSGSGAWGEGAQDESLLTDSNSAAWASPDFTPVAPREGGRIVLVLCATGALERMLHSHGVLPLVVPGWDLHSPAYALDPAAVLAAAAGTYGTVALLCHLLSRGGGGAWDWGAEGGDQPRSSGAAPWHRALSRHRFPGLFTGVEVASLAILGLAGGWGPVAAGAFLLRGAAHLVLAAACGAAVWDVVRRRWGGPYRLSGGAGSGFDVERAGGGGGRAVTPGAEGPSNSATSQLASLAEAGVGVALIAVDAAHVGLATVWQDSEGVASFFAARQMAFYARCALLPGFALWTCAALDRAARADASGPAASTALAVAEAPPADLSHATRVLCEAVEAAAAASDGSRVGVKGRVTAGGEEGVEGGGGHAGESALGYALAAARTVATILDRGRQRARPHGVAAAVAEAHWFAAVADALQRADATASQRGVRLGVLLLDRVLGSDASTDTTAVEEEDPAGLGAPVAASAGARDTAASSGGHSLLRGAASTASMGLLTAGGEPSAALSQSTMQTRPESDMEGLGDGAPLGKVSHQHGLAEPRHLPHAGGGGPLSTPRRRAATRRGRAAGAGAGPPSCRGPSRPADRARAPRTGWHASPSSTTSRSRPRTRPGASRIMRRQAGRLWVEGRGS